jgi:hypothetical protein
VHIAADTPLLYQNDMENELKSARVQLVLTPSQRLEIENFRFDHRVKNESETIRRLIRTGMKAVSEGLLPLEE